MEQKALEEAYWRILKEITQVPDVKSAAAFMFMDTDAWIWSVKLYRVILTDYCKNPTFEKDDLGRHIVATNSISSKHDQAKKILTLLKIQDESEEGWWLKQFRAHLDHESSKGGNPDRRSFTTAERPRFFEKVRDLALKVDLTSITLGLALLETQHIRNNADKRVKKILETLPAKTEEFFLPKSHILKH